jgi:hypothetical protein
VIHEDIVTVWNFDNRDGVSLSFVYSVLFAEGNQYLFGREFTATMTNLVEDTARIPEVSYVDSHADRRTHLEESNLDAPDLETFTHVASRTHPEEIHLDAPPLNSEATITVTGMIPQLREIYLDAPDLETFTQAAPRTHPEEIYPDSPNLNLDVPMAPWTSSSYKYE